MQILQGDLTYPILVLSGSSVTWELKGRATEGGGRWRTEGIVVGTLTRLDDSWEAKYKQALFQFKQWDLNG